MPVSSLFQLCKTSLSSGTGLPPTTLTAKDLEGRDKAEAKECMEKTERCGGRRGRDKVKYTHKGRVGGGPAWILWMLWHPVFVEICVPFLGLSGVLHNQAMIC